MSSLWQDWIPRVLCPRSGLVRVVAVTVASAAVELDNDLFQVAPGGGAAGRPGDYGRGLLRLQADGSDVYVVFGPTNGVVSNSAAVAGVTQSALIPNSAGAAVAGGNIGTDFEINPLTDKWMAISTKNGGATTAFLRYWIRTVPMSRDGALQGGA
jgi:hypothetical protein